MGLLEKSPQNTGNEFLNLHALMNWFSPLGGHWVLMKEEAQLPPLDWKSNPPYPPLSGGYKKAMRPRRAEGA